MRICDIEELHRVGRMPGHPRNTRVIERASEDNESMEKNERQTSRARETLRDAVLGKIKHCTF